MSTHKLTLLLFVDMMGKYSIKFVPSLPCNLKYKIEHTTEFHGSSSVVKKDSDMQYWNESISMVLSPTCLIFVSVYHITISKQIILFLNEQQSDSE